MNSDQQYLTLLKKCLTNTIYSGDAQIKYYSSHSRIKNKLISLLISKNSKIIKKAKYNPEDREYGRDWPMVAHTMVGSKRLDNIQFCIENVIKDNTPGDFIETGVWRGGSVILMRAILKLHNITDRKVWVCDSFEGLPPPDADKYPADFGDRHFERNELKISLEEVQNNFKTYDLLDNQVKFLKGWFKDTLPTAPIDKLAIVRLDGDMYESTMDGLTNLYHKLSHKGYIIIDDYSCLECCKAAVTDFRKQNSINDKIYDIDGTGVYWQKS